MTATATRKPRTRKPARKPERSATLGSMTNGKTVLWLTQDGEARAYVLTPLASDFGTAYRLGKADNGDGKMDEYDVLLNGRETSCTCPGHNYRGKCKHVEALEALIRAGKLPSATAKQVKPEAPQQPQAKPEVQQPAKREPWCSHCNDNPNVWCEHCTL